MLEVLVVEAPPAAKGLAVVDRSLGVPSLPYYPGRSLALLAVVSPVD